MASPGDAVHSISETGQTGRNGITMRHVPKPLLRHSLAAALLLFTLTACSKSSDSSAPPPSEPEVITLGAASSPKYAAVFDAMRRDFERQGQAFEYTLYKDYPTLIDAFLRGEVDFAWNTPLAHARAMILTNDGVIGPIARDVDVQHTLHIVVRKDSGVDSIQDLPGRTMVLGRIESAGSQILPRYYLKREGIDIDAQCTIKNLDGLVDDQMNPLSTTSNVLAAVTNGEGDACAVGEKSTRALRADPSSPLKVIWSSPRYTHCIMTCRRDYNPRLLAVFKRVLLSETLDDPIGAEVLINEGCDRAWIDTENARDQQAGFADLIAAVQEQGVPLQPALVPTGVEPVRLGTLASSEAINAFRALERYVLREGMTGFSVTYYGTREQLETALFEGRIDVAWNRPLDHVRAILRSEGTADDDAVATVSRDIDLTLHSQIIVRKDSGITDLSGLSGQSLAFGSSELAELSVLPRHFLKESGFDLEDVTVLELDGRLDDELRPADRSGDVVEAVRSGMAVAGAVDDKTAQAILNDPSSELTVIWVSPSFAGHTMTTLDGRLSSATRSQFETLLKSMTPSDPTGGVVLGELDGASAFVDPTANGYSPLITALER